MKVTFDGIDKINSEFIQKDLKRVKDTEKESENVVSEDKVEISSKALDLKAMQEQAMQAPDVRMEKVASIKTRVDSGTYEISHEEIAERMIEESLTG
jgi:negative regulator of flagellin synthesis FlgM